MNRKLNVGVVGATGLVGELFLNLLEERKFPLGELRLFASDRSKGQTRTCMGRSFTVETPAAERFSGLDVVFFSSGDDVSREWGPIAVKAGCVVIDNSAAFRMDPDKILAVPEVNGHLLPKKKEPILIANPNCSTIQLVCALKPLHDDFGLESVHVATYQAVSGAGKAAQEELREQMTAWAQNKSEPNPQAFPHPIHMNCIPQIGSFSADGFCSEEIKIIRETKKILGNNTLRVSAFTTRVPVWNTHSEAVWVRLKRPVEKAELIASLRRQHGLIVEDEDYPTPRCYDGRDPVAVGRIHRDLDDPQTWIFWVVGDNLRKGAALNGIQIAERIFDIPAPA